MADGLHDGGIEGVVPTAVRDGECGCGVDGVGGVGGAVGGGCGGGGDHVGGPDGGHADGRGHLPEPTPDGVRRVRRGGSMDVEMPTPTASAVALDPGDPMLIDGVTSGNVSRARDGGGGGGEEGGGGGGGPPGTLAAASSPVAAQGAPAGGGDATGGSAANPPSPQPLRSPDVGPPPPGGSLLGRGGLAAGPPGADGLALPRRDAMSLEPPTAIVAGRGGPHAGWVVDDRFLVHAVSCAQRFPSLARLVVSAEACCQ